LVVGMDLRNNATGALIDSDVISTHSAIGLSLRFSSFTSGRVAFSSHENRTTGYISFRRLVR